MAKYFNKPAPYFFKPTYTDEGVIRQLFNAFENLDRSELNKLIANGYDINLSDKNGRNGLHVILNIDDNKTSESAKLPFVKELIERGIDVNKGDKDHKTPLHISAYKQYEKITKILLDNGALIDYKDINGMTPLHLALTRLVKSCPEEKKISELIKEPDFKDTVNSKIVKMVLNNFFDKLINDTYDVKKIMYFIQDQINNFDKIETDNSIKKYINNAMDGLVKKMEFEKDNKQFIKDTNIAINNLIIDVQNHIEKKYKKLFESTLTFKVIDHNPATNSSLFSNDSPINGNITSDNSLTIFSSKIGNDLLISDMNTNDVTMMTHMDNINKTSSSIISPEKSEPGLLELCSSLIEPKGSVHLLVRNSDKLYKMLNGTLAWWYILGNTGPSSTDWKVGNSAAPKLASVTIIPNVTGSSNIATYSNMMIAAKSIASSITDMRNDYSSLFNIDNNNNVYDIINGSIVTQYNNVDFGNIVQKLPKIDKIPLENEIRKHFNTFININKQPGNIFYNNDESQMEKNINVFINTINDAVLNGIMPIETSVTGSYIPLEIINTTKRGKSTEYTIQLSKTAGNIPIPQLGSSVGIHKYAPQENVLGTYIYGVVQDIIDNRKKYFDRLIKLPKENPLLDVYNEVVGKFIGQYYYVGRLIYLINNIKMEYTNSIILALERFRKLEKEKEWISLYEEIIITFNQLLGNLDSLILDKEKLIKALHKQRDNVIEYINLLNIKNGQNFLLHNFTNNKYITKLEYDDKKTITQLLPTIEKINISGVLNSIPVSANIILPNVTTPTNMVINRKFFEPVIPKHNDNEIYVYDKASSVTTKPSPFWDVDSVFVGNATINNSIIDALNTVKPNLVANISSYNVDYTNEKLTILNPISGSYLGYVKDLLYLQTYKALEPINAEKAIFGNISENLPPIMKDPTLNTSANLYPTTMYFQIVDKFLKEQFHAFTYNIAAKKISGYIQTANLDGVIVFPQLKDIKLNKIIENTDDYTIDFSKDKHNMFKNLLASSNDVVNKKFFETKEKVLRLYELDKNNETNKICIYNDKKVVDLLLNKAKGKYDVTDEDGNTPLIYAINGLLTNVIDSNFLDKFEILNIKNKNNIRPIEQAIKNANAFYKIYYDRQFSDILNNMTDKYTSKLQKELMSIPEFGNNILKSTTNSMKKFAILLSYYLNQYIVDDEITNGLSFLTSDTPIEKYENLTKYLFDARADIIKKFKNITRNSKIQRYNKYINIINPIIDNTTDTDLINGNITVMINNITILNTIPNVEIKLSSSLILPNTSSNSSGAVASTKLKDYVNYLEPRIDGMIKIYEDYKNISSNIGSASSLKYGSLATNVPTKPNNFTTELIKHINIDNTAYSNIFDTFIGNIDTKINEDGLLLFKRLHDDYQNIVGNVKVAFEEVKNIKLFAKDKFTIIRDEITKQLDTYNKIQTFMNGYEKNISLSKSRNLEDNRKLRDIILLYQAVLLSDITYPLKDTILTTIAQYQEQTMMSKKDASPGVKDLYGINFGNVDIQLTNKLITNDFTATTPTTITFGSKPELTFTGLILLNKFNLRHTKADKGNYVYKDIGDLLSDVSTVLNTEIIATYRNTNVKYSDILEKNIFAFYKKNYSVMIECLQQLFNDIMAFYINCGRHLQLLKLLLDKLLL